MGMSTDLDSKVMKPTNQRTVEDITFKRVGCSIKPACPLETLCDVCLPLTRCALTGSADKNCRNTLVFVAYCGLCNRAETWFES